MDLSGIFQSIFGSPAPAAAAPVPSYDDALRRQIATSILERTQNARDQAYPVSAAPQAAPTPAAPQAAAQSQPTAAAPDAWDSYLNNLHGLPWLFSTITNTKLPSALSGIPAQPQNMLAASPGPQSAMLAQPMPPSPLAAAPAGNVTSSPLPPVASQPAQASADPSLPQNAPVPTPAPSQGSPISAALLSPNLSAPGSSSNQMQAPADPWASLLGITPLTDAQAAQMGKFPAAPPPPGAVDPTNTTSTGAPASPQAALSSAAAASPSLWQKYKSFTSSDRGQALNSFFTGLAMGRTPQQSLGYGAQMMAATAPQRQKRDQVNQTAQWLAAKGMSTQDASLLASNPTALADYLKTSLTPTKPVSVGAGTSLVDPKTGKVLYKGDAQPSFGPIGQDEYGNTTYGWRNPSTGAVTPANGPNMGAPNSSPGQTAGATAYSPGQVAELHGDDFLKSLPESLGNQVKAYASGKMPMPTGYALKSPYFQKMMQMVTQYDPTFDAVNYNSRAKTRADFTSGKSAQSINALNTVIGHLQTLGQAADALNNGSIPALNSVNNWLSNAEGNPQIKDFNTTKKAVVDELTRVWRGSGGSEGDIKTWADQINSSNSPAQLHAVIGKVGDLLESKINALGETYKQGMGTTADPIQFVTPQSQKALDAMRQAGTVASAPNAAKGGTTSNGVKWSVVQP